MATFTNVEHGSGRVMRKFLKIGLTVGLGIATCFLVFLMVYLITKF